MGRPPREWERSRDVKDHCHEMVKRRSEKIRSVKLLSEERATSSEKATTVISRENTKIAQKGKQTTERREIRE